MFEFTVFTPTFQRANTLNRVYDSLSAQTFKNFEWVIIDDGSNDGTRELVLTWIKEARFSIRYSWQVNQGKHVAVNNGVLLARGYFFLIADSDDAFLPTALEELSKHWNSIEDKSAFTGVTGLCVTLDGKVVGDKFPSDIIDSDSEEIFYKYNVTGEKWGFHKTSILKEFPFPVPKNMNFVLESYIWFRIARKYKTRFINIPLRIYITDSQNQLSKRSINDMSMYNIYYIDNLDLSLKKWFFYNPVRFFKTAIQYIRLSLHNGESITYAISRAKNRFTKTLLLVCVPLASLIYYFDVKSD
jgi:glycosyltransferase involved in cell wall biosynthesis